MSESDTDLDPPVCTTCGKPLPASAPDGYCPSCLFGMLGGEDPLFDPGGELDPGTRVMYFGDFELEEVIGRGGVGVVYRARQKSLDRPVALKMLLSADLASEETSQRFLIEARATAGLEHDHIVPIYEVGEHDGQSYIAMKWIEGCGTIDQLTLPNSPRRAQQVQLAGAIAKVASAVAYAHSRGVLHRDLKPANILLTRDREPVLSDFGLAKILGADGAGELTRSHVIMGTPEFVAPEVVEWGSRVVTTAVDVYGIGAILYQLITGRPPSGGGSTAEVLQSVTGERVIPPKEYQPEIEPDLEIICLKCLERDPDDRYATAAEVAADLGRFARGEAIAARPLKRMRRLWLWMRRHPAKVALVLACSLVVFAFVSMFGNFMRGMSTWSDGFGHAIAAQGGTLVIGEAQNTHFADKGGTAMVLDLDSGARSALYPSDPIPRAWFGDTVATDGEWLVVGAPRHRGGSWKEGVAYVFDLAEGDQVARLVAPDQAWYNHFGSSVAVADGLVAVGANKNTHQGRVSGTVYLYDAATGEFLSDVGLTMNKSALLMGHALALDDHLLAISASQDWGKSGQAAVHLIDVSDPVHPIHVHTIKESDHRPAPWLGESIALGGGRLVVGSTGGRAFLFDASSYDLIAALPGGAGGATAVAVGSETVAVRQSASDGNAASVKLFSSDDGSFLRTIQCPDKPHAAGFAHELELEGTFLITGQEGVEQIGDSHTPVYVFDLQSGELDRRIRSFESRRFLLPGDWIFYSAATLCILAPIVLTSWLVTREGGRS